MDAASAYTTAHFFKVLMPGFHQTLSLPPAVSRDLEKFKSETAILQSPLGKWKIGLSKDSENGLICFERGWPEFVERHALNVEDFLEFESTYQHLHYTVCVFESSGSEKEFSTPTVKEKEEEALCFSKTMLPCDASHDARVYIPREFMRSNNLGTQRSAVLRDCKGGTWKVRLVSAGRDGCRQRLTRGWHAFYKSNALKDGDTCIFKLVPSELTSTTIFFDVHIKNASS